jgi:hypothetical protein
MAQAPANLFEGAVSFLMVALVTGGNDILPSMGATATTWLHVVDRGRWGGTVDALATIASKDCSA